MGPKVDYRTLHCDISGFVWGRERSFGTNDNYLLGFPVEDRFRDFACFRGSAPLLLQDQTEMEFGITNLIQRRRYPVILSPFVS